MNKRIDEIVRQATEDILGVKILDKKKFAELIVGECAATVENFYQEDQLDCRSARTEILDHFGIER